MFDIGFWELMLVLIVALVVVGPERLPGLVRTVGFLFGKTKRTLNSIRAEIAQELAAEELKNTIRRQVSSESFDEIIEETKKVVEPTLESLNSPIENILPPEQTASATTPKPEAPATATQVTNERS